MRFRVTGHVIAVDNDTCPGCRICDLACSFFNAGETDPATGATVVNKNKCVACSA